MAQAKVVQSKTRSTLRPIVAKDQLYENLRMEIISFDLEPGERISETQLANRFDVGLAAVRAALPKLVQEGLVINQRRLGHAVAPITIQDVHDICQLREMLEPQAAQMAAQIVDVEELEAIDEQSKRPTVKGDKEAELKSLIANRDFHVTIAAASGNERLRIWIAQLQDFSIRFHYLLRHSRSLSSEWEHSHEPIINAFKQRDGDLAEQEMRLHLSRGRELIMKSILLLPNIQDVNIGDLDPIR